MLDTNRIHHICQKNPSCLVSTLSTHRATINVFVHYYRKRPNLSIMHLHYTDFLQVEPKIGRLVGHRFAKPQPAEKSREGTSVVLRDTIRLT